MPASEDVNPYFNVKNWGSSSRGSDFGFGSSTSPAKYEALFLLQVQSDPQYLLSVGKDNTRGPLVVLSNENKSRQIWKKVDFGDHFALVNQKTGFALQVNGDGAGVTLSKYRIGGNPSPSNLLKAGPHKGEGYVPLLSAQDTNLVIGLKDKHAANGVEVVSESWSKQSTQIWRLIPAGTVYTIRPKLDIAYGLATQRSDARGCLVINQIKESSDHFTTWYIELVGNNEVKLINSASGFAVKRSGSSKQIEQAEPSTGGRDAVWVIGENTGSHFYGLHPATAPHESADVNGNTAHDGCKVRTVNYGGGDDQIWGFFPLHADVPVDPLGRRSSTSSEPVDQASQSPTGYGSRYGQGSAGSQYGKGSTGYSSHYAQGSTGYRSQEYGRRQGGGDYAGSRWQ